MGIQIDKARALTILEAAAAEAGQADADISDDWVKPIRAFSQACEGASRTHIAFLGTALLAKATDLRADAFAVKAGANTPGAFSARSLGHGVLVEHSKRLDINLGVTGREPLNNQPYFRIKRATRAELWPLVKENARPAVQVLIGLLGRIDGLTESSEARRALRAFIAVRREFNQVVPELDFDSTVISFDQLIGAIPEFVHENSEGGKRAQAVAAGLLDVLAGTERVATDRINDPDRHMAGDVGIRYPDDSKAWERVFEVRDKPVRESDLYHFTQKAADAQVPKAIMLALSSKQEMVDPTAAIAWAHERGVSLAQYVGWQEFAHDVLFWCSLAMDEAAAFAFTAIRERLVQVEASSEAIASWDGLFGEDKT